MDVQRRCPECRAEVQPDQSFCGFCGKPTPEPAPDGEAAPRSRIIDGMIILAIIGILVSIAIPNFTRGRKERRACLACQQNINQAWARYCRKQSVAWNTFEERFALGSGALLLQRGYLGKVIVPPLASCSYVLAGPTGGKRQISCALHGDRE